MFDFIVELDCSTRPARPANRPPALFRLNPEIAFIFGVLISTILFLFTAFSFIFFYDASDPEPFFSVDKFKNEPIFFDLADRNDDGFMFVLA